MVVGSMAVLLYGDTQSELLVSFGDGLQNSLQGLEVRLYSLLRLQGHIAVHDVVGSMSGEVPAGKMVYP